MKIKKITFLLVASMLFFAIGHVSAQKKHKVVFQFTNAVDTMQQKAFTRQLFNLLEHWPTAKIEVVVYNQGIGYLMTKNSKHLDEIKKLKTMGVDFVVCQNTMKQRNVKAEDLVPEARMVPAGIAEIVEKQEKNWSYIKGGF